MTFDQFRHKEVSTDDILLPSKSLVKSLDEHFVSLLVFQSQLKVMHWGTESYAEHNAYGSTYSDVDSGLDALVESYQGYHGRIDFGSNCDFISFKDVEVNSWLGSILECLNSLREELKESDLQNLTDEIIANVSKLKYLLTLK
jgi:DNA-binding ferritin-like protein